MAYEIEIQKIGLSKQTNPSAKLDGERAEPLFDDLGRGITRYTIRDLIVTAAASLVNGTKTSLVTGVSGSYLDLKQITLSNNSSAATTVTLTDESTTVRTIDVPANDAVHLVFDPALPQNTTGVDWYVDLPDITGTTISVNAEFINEV